MSLELKKCNFPPVLKIHHLLNDSTNTSRLRFAGSYKREKKSYQKNDGRVLQQKSRHFLAWS